MTRKTETPAVPTQSPSGKGTKLSARDRQRLRDGFAQRSARKDADEVIDLDATVVRDSRGQRITEADAARIAEDTLAELRRPGRPSLSGAGQKSPQIAFRVSAEARQMGEQRAREEGRTLSELARHAFEQYVRSPR